MVKIPSRPTDLRVAKCAVSCQPPQVNVISLVTGGTPCRGILVLGGRMTSFAGHDCMQSDNWKICKIMVEIDGNAPTLRRVTIVAFAAQLTLVSIFIRVTRLAFSGNAQRLVRLMAVLALGSGVLVCQPETCFVMVKLGGFPRSLAMAIFAGLAQLRVMNIRQLVAVPAGRLQICINFAHMAGHASNLGMGIYELELGLVVFIGFQSPPTVGGMAALTCLSESTLMRLRCLMAGKAIN